jgi:hypothetical protein
LKCYEQSLTLINICLGLEILKYVVLDLDWELERRICERPCKDMDHSDVRLVCDTCDTLDSLANQVPYLPMVLHIREHRVMYSFYHQRVMPFCLKRRPRWKTARIAPQYTTVMSVCRQLFHEVLDVVCDNVVVPVHIEVDQTHSEAALQINRSPLLRRARHLDILIYFGLWTEDNGFKSATDTLLKLEKLLNDSRKTLNLCLEFDSILDCRYRKPTPKVKGRSTLDIWVRPSRKFPVFLIWQLTRPNYRVEQRAFVTSVGAISLHHCDITILNAPKWLQGNSKFSRQLQGAAGGAVRHIRGR